MFLLRFNIIDFSFLIIIFITIYGNGTYLIKKIFKIDDSLFSFRLGIGCLPIYFGIMYLSFFHYLTYLNIIIMLALLQLPLLSILVNGSFKQNIIGHIYNKDINKYYFLLFIFFLLIIFTGTEYLTPGDKYRWVAIKQFIKFGGYTDVSYDFRNMSPLSAETFLLFGMVIRGESLALMINTLFPLFISISILDFY